MSSSNESVRVVIFGDEFSIKSDVDGDTTKKIAEYVNLKMSEVQSCVPSRDKFKIAVMSAMNIAGELLDYKEKCQEYLEKCEEFQKKAKEIGRKIDERTEHF